MASTDAIPGQPQGINIPKQTRNLGSPGTRRRSSNISRIRGPEFPTPRWYSPASRPRPKRKICGPISSSSARTARRSNHAIRERLPSTVCAWRKLSLTASLVPVLAQKLHENKDNSQRRQIDDELQCCRLIGIADQRVTLRTPAVVHFGWWFNSTRPALIHYAELSGSNLVNSLG